MSQFTLVFRHYMRRCMLEPIGILILVVLPVVIISIMSLVFSNGFEESEIMVNGYNMASTQIATGMFIIFQFYGGNIMLDWIYTDFKSARRWRLFSAPCPPNTFIFSAGLSSWIFTIIQGILILAISALFFDVYLGNLIILAMTLILLSTLGQFMYMLIFFFTTKKAVAEGVAQGVIWAMAIASGWLTGFTEAENPVIELMRNYGSPFSIARRAIVYSGFMGNDMAVAVQAVCILFAITALSGVIVVIIGRRRSF